MRKITKIISILLVVLLSFTTLALVACDDTKKFVYPSMPSDGEVTSNGGVAVGYGEYIYYVNGNVSDASVDNKYTGEPKFGDIVRVKTSSLSELMALNDDDNIASNDLPERLAKDVHAKVETVVPMIYYNGNATNTTVNGLFIYGDKLYFTTPNTALTAGGNKQTDQLCIYRADLDGKNLTNLHTITKNTLVVMLAEVDGVVYAVYDNEDLFVVNLSTANTKATTLAEDITQAKYSQQDGTVYYVNKDAEICLYVAGASEPKVLLANSSKDNITYTISSVNQGYVYYTVKDSRDSMLSSPVYAIKEGWEQSKIIYITTPKDSYIGYKESIIVTGSKFNSTPTMYQLYITSGDGATVKYIIPQNTNSTAVTISSLIGDILTYSVGSKVYTVDLSQDPYVLTHLRNTITPAGWSYVDSLSIGDKTYFIALSSSNTVMIYDFDGKDTQSTNITRLPIEED